MTELSTGNALMVWPWLEGLKTTRALQRNWSLLYLGNLVGALMTVVFAVLSETLDPTNLSATVARMASVKLPLTPTEAVFCAPVG